MAFRLIPLVWNLKLEPSEKFVLMKLADNANDEGTHCFPSIRRMAYETGYSTRTIGRIIASLTAKGIVSILERGNQVRPNHYELHLENGVKLSEFIHSKWASKRAQDKMSPAKPVLVAQDTQSIGHSRQSTGHPEQEHETSVQEHRTSTTGAQDTMSTESIIKLSNKPINKLSITYGLAPTYHMSQPQRVSYEYEDKPELDSDLQHELIDPMSEEERFELTLWENLDKVDTIRPPK